MEFRLLGPVEVLVDGVTLPIGGAKPRAILAMLLLDAGRPVFPTALIDEVWGDDPPPSVRNSLQVHISNIRRALRDAGEPDRLSHGPGGYRIEVGPGELDTQRFVELVERARAARDARQLDQATQLLADALALWRGDALQNVREVALVEAATGWDRRRLATVLEYATVQLELGEADRVLELLETETVTNPLDEALHELHLRALHQLGRWSQASRVYHGFAERLEAYLGAQPSDALRRLHDAILVQDPELEDGRPEHRDDRGHGLPEFDSTFVGRSAELIELKRLIEASRVVTVTGPGGCGKTRLVRAVADELGATQRVAWVDLAPVREPSKLLPTVSDVTGTPDPHVSSIADTLDESMDLIVLDNCEHLRAACAATVEALAGRSHSTSIVLTSRVPLGIDSEVTWRLPGLLTPDASSPLDPQRLRRFEAVQLFAERAAEADPSFAVDHTTGARVAAICERLGGIPLALELAAARLRTSSIGRIADELDHLLGLLAPTSPRRHGRAQTLRHTLDWSYRQLDEVPASVFRQLSVFVGGFTADAAARVCRLDDVEDVLGTLHTASLLEVRSSSPVRYLLHELIREFAAEQLVVAGDPDGVRRRHVEWLADLCQKGRASGLHGLDQARWFQRIVEERANIRTAVTAARDLGHHESAAHILDGSWYVLGDSAADEVFDWLSPFLEPGQDELGAELSLRLLHAAAMMRLRRRWDLDAAAPLQRAAAAAHTAGEIDLELEITANLGALLVTNGDARGLPMIRDATARAEGRGTFAEVVCWYVLARFAFDTGRIEEGIQAAQRTVELADARGDSDLRNGGLAVVLEASMGDPGEAGWRTASEILRSYRRLGDRSGVADALSLLGLIALRRDRHDDALHLMLEALRAGHDTTALTEVPVLARTAQVLAAMLRWDDVLRVDGHLEGIIDRYAYPVPSVLRGAYDAAVATAAATLGPDIAGAARAVGRRAHLHELIGSLARST